MPDVTAESNQLIDAFITDALAKTFSQDPAFDPATSRLVSVYSSLVRKDGYLVQHAIERSLRRAQNLDVWQEPQFEISRAADQIATHDAIETALNTKLPYGIDTHRSISRDLIVVDANGEFAGSYDVKRGSAAVDSGKRRQVLRDTLCTHMLLAGYVRQHGYEVQRAEAKVISVYGRTGLPPQITIKGNELNAYFAADIEADLHRCAENFRAALAQVMPHLGFRRL